jgi:RNA polymerase sigma-70 factor (ECF subfamily)
VEDRALKRAPQLRLVQPSSGAAEGPRRETPPSLDDNELVAAVRLGDDTASIVFYGRLRPRVEGTVLRLLGRRDSEHEDFVQHALVEIVRSLVSYRGECSLEGWAASIAARIVYKRLRSRSRERRIFATDALDDEASPGVSADRIAIARDLCGRVRRHLDAIDEDKAWTFLLHDVCGFDLREISEITGASVSAVQTRLVRGRREVHDRMSRDRELAAALEEMGVDA